MASVKCRDSLFSEASRSAIVRATFKTRSWRAPLPVRKFKSAISQGRLPSLAALFYRIVREANHIEVGHLGRADSDLHLYAVRVDPVYGSTVSLEEHRLGTPSHSRMYLRRQSEHRLVAKNDLGLTEGFTQLIYRGVGGSCLSGGLPIGTAHQAPRLAKLRHLYLK